MRISPPRAEVTPQLQFVFFQPAYAILPRPQLPPEHDHSSAGVAGDYMVLRRLLPLFERYVTAGDCGGRASHFKALSASVVEDLRQGDNEWVRKGVQPRESTGRAEALAALMRSNAPTTRPSATSFTSSWRCSRSVRAPPVGTGLGGLESNHQSHRGEEG